MLLDLFCTALIRSFSAHVSLTKSGWKGGGEPGFVGMLLVLL
jgi:hypothetical protein